MQWLNFLIDWSEVWGMLISLIVILLFRPKGSLLKWLKIYVIFSFLFLFLANFSIQYYIHTPSWLVLKEGNNLYYNFHSSLMVIYFSIYIMNIRDYKFPALLKALLAGYILFVIVNFIFFDSPMLLSTLHFAVGSTVLLIMCLFYFFRSIVDDESNINWLRHPSFIICTGLCLYQVITFFIWLFIYPITTKGINYDKKFALAMMQIHQVIFVVFCILLAIGLYKHSQLDKKKAA